MDVDRVVHHPLVEAVFDDNFSAVARAVNRVGIGGEDPRVFSLAQTDRDPVEMDVLAALDRDRLGRGVVDRDVLHRQVHASVQEDPRFAVGVRAKNKHRSGNQMGVFPVRGAEGSVPKIDLMVSGTSISGWLASSSMR